MTHLTLKFSAMLLLGAFSLEGCTKKQTVSPTPAPMSQTTVDQELPEDEVEATEEGESTDWEEETYPSSADDDDEEGDVLPQLDESDEEDDDYSPETC